MSGAPFEAAALRPVVTGARRVVVKVGSSSLTTAEGGIDPQRLQSLVDVLAATRARGTEVVLVSSGAIAAGLAPLGMKRRPTLLAEQQAAASVGQGLLVHHYTTALRHHGITAGQVLLTVDDVTRRAHYRNAAQTVSALLGMDVLPIVNENDTVATTEIRFGDNDRLAALVAHLVRADLLVLLSDVDGLYDADPRTPGARLLSEVHGLDDLADVAIGKTGAAGVGTGGMETKVEAASIATGAGVPVVLTSAGNAGAALAGDHVGTLFHATGRKRKRRLLWLQHATEGRGSIVLDAGAVRAVTERGASLLAAGVTGAHGDFHAGDPVDLVGPDGEVVARGLVNYDADEIPGLLARTAPEKRREREVVHRDALVLL
ncbi:glutamate 5-kinase [Nocardioides bruguierae]|uniref:Glutamate 5-kinase n=1 Tax=Nocardioides bruguierae TaxID=2945102 RepID=A0A9X2IFI7_9ACTN|nr:glutamate 5-kinase [Nocardioides bruguierae]MCM0619765.1 glutamate 5-kinase [Nocardioides bruguierae]